jgi:N-acetylmuramoyl-L-alanine amidase
MGLMSTARGEWAPSTTALEESGSAGNGAVVLPLRLGAMGDAVSDLQFRLVGLGYGIGSDDPGTYGPGTELAVRAFQEQRGLRSDGVCGQQTWSGVVEASFSLGDRLLYRRSPMLHGDDVADLQRRLAALGFDCGRVDGIFGDRTARALADFQRNVGVASDGICGPHTVQELDRLGYQPSGWDLVTTIRERLRAASRPATLRGRHVAVGEEGGFSVAVRATCRALSVAGALPLGLHHPDPSEQAATANLVAADCYVGLRLDPEHPAVRTYFYRGYRYESLPSRKLAELLQSSLVAALGMEDGGTYGMALPILRETQMPAVLIEVGEPNKVVTHVVDLANAVVRSVDLWLSLEWN